MLVSADIRKTSSNAWYSQSLHYPLLRNPQCMHYLVPSRDLRCGYRHVVVSVELCKQRRVKMKKKKKKRVTLPDWCMFESQLVGWLSVLILL